MAYTVQQLINDLNGKSIDVDGVAGPQCVDVAKYFNNKLGYSPRYGNGKDWINNAGNDYNRVNYSPGLVPPEGAIVSWSGNPPANVPYGHVAIATGKGDRNTFQTFDQNWGGPVCKLNNHSYQSVQGWIVPKNYGGGGVDMVQRDQLTYLYNVILDRNPDPGADGYLGKNWWEVVVALDQSEEHRQLVANKAAAKAALESQAAKVPSLEDQITVLVNQQTNLQETNKNLADQIDVLNNEVASLKKQLADGSVTVPSPSQPLIDYSLGELLVAIWTKITRSIK